ncbi:MAG: hypothetical protein MUF22_03130 [Chitinispirillaceae bacterium]|nr:hypothetical protein [Chitinispirillaceae bacterium]
MKRRILFALAISLMIGSCARMEERSPRYDEHQCPFCVGAKGVCTYCEGSKKCRYCRGMARRTVVVPDLPQSGIKKTSYTEQCPHCTGGACRHCQGTGVCRTCKGTGRIDSWDFYGSTTEPSPAGEIK